MALQTSGQISLSQIQTEFGGANPTFMSEYYRGGSYVPSTLGGPAGAWSSYLNTWSGVNSRTYAWEVETFGEFIFLRLHWAGVEIYSSYAAGIQNETQINGVTDPGGTAYDYGRGSPFTYIQGGKAEPSHYMYPIRRRTSETSETVNAGIPASGQIGLFQFYGGRKT